MRYTEQLACSHCAEAFRCAEELAVFALAEATGYGGACLFALRGGISLRGDDALWSKAARYANEFRCARTTALFGGSTLRK